MKQSISPAKHRRRSARRRGIPDIENIPGCVQDVKKAVLDTNAGPPDPTDYGQLRTRLQRSTKKLPPLYQQNVFLPFDGKLDELGKSGFRKILLRDRKKEKTAGMMLDIAHSILQNGEGYNDNATDAFQEVVSDLYDGFLSAEDRKGIKNPDEDVVPPLVKWGNPKDGPYTWPVDSTSFFGLNAGVVNLPPANAGCGLAAWGALGHETAGHDILGADRGLYDEILTAVDAALHKERIGHGLPDYWTDRIDETASDVLGILNMGPAAALGIICLIRGMNAAFSGRPVLSGFGPEDDPHPADMLRGYLAASTVGLLSFTHALGWGGVIESETDKDFSGIVLCGKVIEQEFAKRSAIVIAHTIAKKKLASLNNHSLIEIQDWHDRDERIAGELGKMLLASTPLPEEYPANMYATHAVAAAITTALSGGADIPKIFDRMQVILKTMHNDNPSWGPLYVKHPGDLAARVLYPKWRG